MQSGKDVVSLDSIGCVKSSSTVGKLDVGCEMEDFDDVLLEEDLLEFAQGLVEVAVGSVVAGCDRGVR